METTPMRHILACALLLAGSLNAADGGNKEASAEMKDDTQSVQTSIDGDTLKINGNATKLGAQNWAEPERSWRTVGELIKSAVPPPDENGKRPGVTLVCGIDEKAPWGALKALLLAASGLGIEKARINVPGKPDAHIDLPLPGADPKAGAVVDFPVAAKDDKIFTRNGNRELEITQKLLEGLIKQQPQATIHVMPESNTTPALQVMRVLRMLHQDVKPAAVAYLPVKEVTAEEKADQQEAKDAVNRAFEGGLGGMGK